jgi:hypothetical protein
MHLRGHVVFTDVVRDARCSSPIAHFVSGVDVREYGHVPRGWEWEHHSSSQFPAAPVIVHVVVVVVVAVVVAVVVFLVNFRV